MFRERYSRSKRIGAGLFELWIGDVLTDKHRTKRWAPKVIA